MNGWIVVLNWEKFQHRDMARSDVPPWIKNWTRLLDDPGYLDLTAPQRGVLHGLWLLYAKTRRNVPENTAKLSRQLGVRVTKRTLDALNHAGFIEIVAGNPDSNPAGTDRDRELSVASKAVTVSRGAATPAAHKRRSQKRLDPDLLQQLMALKGADESTPAVLASFARRGLPEAAFRNALEATHHAEGRVRGTEIGYLVGTLRELEKKGQYQ